MKHNSPDPAKSAQHSTPIAARTVLVMINMYCKGIHKSGDRLCKSCDDLSSYAMGRLSRCTFGENKPTCTKCPIHCYRPDMRDEMRRVMRYSGPRMLFRHPGLAVLHGIHTLAGGTAISRKSARNY